MVEPSHEQHGLENTQIDLAGGPVLVELGERKGDAGALSTQVRVDRPIPQPPRRDERPDPLRQGAERVGIRLRQEIRVRGRGDADPQDLRLLRRLRVGPGCDSAHASHAILEEAERRRSGVAADGAESFHSVGEAGHEDDGGRQSDREGEPGTTAMTQHESVQTGLAPSGTAQTRRGPGEQERRCEEAQRAWTVRPAAPVPRHRESSEIAGVLDPEDQDMTMPAVEAQAAIEERPAPAGVRADFDTGEEENSRHLALRRGQSREVAFDPERDHRRTGIRHAEDPADRPRRVGDGLQKVVGDHQHLHARRARRTRQLDRGGEAIPERRVQVDDGDDLVLPRGCLRGHRPRGGCGARQRREQQEDPRDERPECHHRSTSR